MRIYCKACGEKGRIVSRGELSLEFARLCCQCSSPRGHTWVANLTFSHTPEKGTDLFLPAICRHYLRQGPGRSQTMTR
jgi:hypothetical protein